MLRRDHGHHEYNRVTQLTLCHAHPRSKTTNEVYSSASDGLESIASFAAQAQTTSSALSEQCARWNRSNAFG